MNGLKYIRNRCNLSLNDLSDYLGITRQALSAWETGKKPIPPSRQKQLSEFFGIEADFFGDITEEKKKILLEKAMFRYIEDGKEYYKYKPKTADTLNGESIWFLGDTGQTLDEIYLSRQRQKQELLSQIEEVMRYYGKGKTLQDRITALNRGCDIYGSVTTLMNEMPKQNLTHRMAYFVEVKHVLNALLLANDLITEEKLANEYASYKDTIYDGMAWVKELSEILRSHRQTIFDDLDETIRKFREKQRTQKRNEEETSNEPTPVKELIRQAEEQNRSFREEHPELITKSSFAVSYQKPSSPKDN